MLSALPLPSFTWCSPCEPLLAFCAPAVPQGLEDQGEARPQGEAEPARALLVPAQDGQQDSLQREAPPLAPHQAELLSRPRLPASLALLPRPGLSHGSRSGTRQVPYMVSASRRFVPPRWGRGHGWSPGGGGGVLRFGLMRFVCGCSLDGFIARGKVQEIGLAVLPLFFFLTLPSICYLYHALPEQVPLLVSVARLH